MSRGNWSDLDLVGDRCKCGHHYASHNITNPLDLPKDNHIWCVVCKKWCKRGRIPHIYKHL